ncbi:MAG: hypothetical protein F6J87_14300 [Spirulina sp. SIO3F2]|nr:hypothetical protein [Spirulina sp. SIO3F2]
MLRLIIRTTAVLLTISAVLLIVGLFDELLGWDIFSQQLENLLYGVFFSCLVLAGSGIALSFVLGILEIVEIMRASHEGRSLPPAPQFGYYAKRGFAGATALIGLLLLLSFVNAGVQQHRQAVFRQLAEQQTQRFSAKIARALPRDLTAPTVEPELEQVMETVVRSELFWSTVLYLPDPSDADALWYYEGQTYPEPNADEPLKFERLFISNRRETVVSATLKGEAQELPTFIQAKKFVWLEPIQRGDEAKAVLFLRGNQGADFRNYDFEE